MAARKLRVIDGARRDAARKPDALEAAKAVIADLRAALEAEHKLAGQHATERAALVEEYARFRMDAANVAAEREIKVKGEIEDLRRSINAQETRLLDLDRELAETRISRDRLQDEVGRLTLDLAESAHTVEAMKADLSAAQARVSGYVNAEAEARLYERQLQRSEKALTGLARLLGETVVDRDDDEDLRVYSETAAAAKAGP